MGVGGQLPKGRLNMTIYPRGNVYYFEGTVNGKRIKKSTGVRITEPKEKAEAVALSIIKDLEGVDPRITLEQAIELTYNVKWRHNKDTETPMTRARIILEILGNVPLETITMTEVVKLQQALLDVRELAPATVNRYMATLTVIFNTLEMLGHSFPNRPRKIKRLKESSRIRYLTDDEERRMMEFLESYGMLIYADFFACLIDTGMRFSELNSLEFREINFNRRQIHLWVTKGDKPRTIPMTERVFEILSRLKKQTQGARPFGLKYDDVYGVFQQVKRALGLEHDDDFCIHALRHTCASRLVQRGVSIYVVQQILGHSNIQVTEKYAHLNTDVLEEAMEALERGRGKRTTRKAPKVVQMPSRRALGADS